MERVIFLENDNKIHIFEDRIRFSNSKEEMIMDWKDLFEEVWGIDSFDHECEEV